MIIQLISFKMDAGPCLNVAFYCNYSGEVYEGYFNSLHNQLTVNMIRWRRKGMDRWHDF